MQTIKHCVYFSGLALLVVYLTASVAFAQTSAFSYQGRLTEAGNPAAGNYLMQFKLFNTSGTQVGVTLTDVAVSITGGVFNTTLDFGSASFPGDDRFLEIAVKKVAADPYTFLNPRQQILSSPYSIKSRTADTAANAAQLGGTDAARFVQSDTGGNVSVAGNLTVTGSFSLNTVNAQTQYNLGGNRIIGTAGTQNLFVGLSAGRDNTTGSQNTFVGNAAGQSNTSGMGNSFLGSDAGFSNTGGLLNSFFGDRAGRSNTTGQQNSFFGYTAGIANSTGSFNSFFATQAGSSNTTGIANSFFGYGAEAATRTVATTLFSGKVRVSLTPRAVIHFLALRQGDSIRADRLTHSSV